MKAQGIVNKLLETDLDDPSSFLDSHPHFRFVLSSYEGYQVWIASEHDKTLRSLRGGAGRGWAQNIGNVIQGPDDQWFVVAARGLINAEHGFGLRGKSFPTKEAAALAIWSRQHERRGQVPDMAYDPDGQGGFKERRSNKRRRNEALDDEEPEAFIDRLPLNDEIRYRISDGREDYPVTYDGKITRQGSTAFSGQWTVLGMTFHNWSQRPEPWRKLRLRLDRAETLKGYLWDVDHGTTRRWGRRVTMTQIKWLPKATKGA